MLGTIEDDRRTGLISDQPELKTMISLPWYGRPRLRGTSSRPGLAALRRRTIVGLERCEDRTLMASLYGVTAPGDLVRFDSATPMTLVSVTPITGLGAGETILGIDFR